MNQLSLGLHYRRVALLVAVVMATSLPLAWCLSPSLGSISPRPAENVAALLEAQHGLRVERSSLLLREPAGPGGDLRPREVYFLARPPESRVHDLYFAHVILSAAGVPVLASPAFSLSRTSAADEQQLRYDGQRFLAVAAVLQGKTQVVTVFDLEGLSERTLGGFSRGQRLQQGLTSWQESGRFRGLDRLEVRLTVPRPLQLGWKGQLLRASGDGGAFEVLVDPRQARVLRGPAQAQRQTIGKRSFLHWAVDTVRNFSFVGPEKIAWLEDRFYGVVDRARRISGSRISAVEIRDEMALPEVAAWTSSRLEGWPPPPLKPMLPGALKGEGQWVEVKGPFLRSPPGQPSYFAMSFLRPDPERLFARVYFVAWDPRRLDLRMVGGTSEPRSATGELGSGVIPRDQKLLPRLVAAFNGGFQSMHGDFGMMEERRVYCPPKPWAATVARLADGSTGFGTWDGRARPGEVPEWISSFRQNLTPLVEDHVFNPWKRGSWGGGVGFLTGSGPTAQIIRSGLCLHRSGHLMYVLGNPVDGPMLGQAMQKAGCSYAMQLDINSGHVGFEFFNVLRPEETEPQSFTEEKYFQRRGRYPGVDQLRYFTREVVRGTGNAPARYLGRESRDFFYLVERELLPGPSIPASEGRGEGRWTSAALPPPALRFPQAMSRTAVGSRSGKRVHLVALDLRWLDAAVCVPGQGGCLPSSEKPLAVLPLGEFGAGRALLGDGKPLGGGAGAASSRSHLVLRPRRPEGPALAALAAGPESSPGSISIESAAASSGSPLPTRPEAALCPGRDGGLLYASGIGASREDLGAALRAAGCVEPLYLGAVEPLVLTLERGYQTLFGEVLPPLATTPSLLLRRSQASWGSRIFGHVKPQPRSVWTVAQPERTRASALRHAQKTAARLGLPPLKNLEELCRPPYLEAPELKEFRWRDPHTGKSCAGGDPPIKKRRRARPRR